ncbi:MAG: type III-A CRISPR-associated protein Cas10/Csm1, partial [Candidatus Roseilinea sp.]|uniref:type III-A CRISPR-associated protein Cas10/Csm1 n=1 Tax=Candidatus Roseilinea sp. TaxID=2838777 RepID=UPI00404B6A5C
RRLDLPMNNLVYAGGCNFYLLARPGDANALIEFQREISSALYRHHRAALYLAIAHIPLRAADFFGGRVSSAWDQLGRRLARAKQRRFVELGDEVRQLFAPQGRGGNEQQECQVTGLEHPDIIDDEGVRKSPAVVSYEKAGDQLRRARYLILSAFEPRPAARELGNCHEALGELGFDFALADDWRDADPPAPGSTQVALALDDAGVLDLQPLPARAVGRRMFVNVTPIITPEEMARAQLEGKCDDLPRTNRETVKPFCVMEHESEGIPRLGVLRMDVDNLGRIFAEGLGERATLSRVASLSAAISFYFEGYVGTLAREVDNGLNLLYSIYSGGDDLFFVGAWNQVVALAQRVRHALTEYAGGHPGLHVSGGIALVGSKYPLYQAAEDAHQAEQQAKSLRRVVDGLPRNKDALCFLGQALPWEHIGDVDASGFDTATGMYHFLRELAKHSQNKALIGKLAAQYLAYREAEQRRREAGSDRNRTGEEQPLYGPWHWRTEYLLARQEKSAEQEEKKRIHQLRQALHDDAYRSMAWLGLAARWAQLSLRE